MARRVIAIDIDPQLLDLSRHRLAESDVSNIDFIPGNAYRLRKLVPYNVDFVFMANAFHGVPDKPHLVHAVSAILRTGGRFAVVN